MLSHIFQNGYYGLFSENVVYARALFFAVDIGFAAVICNIGTYIDLLIFHIFGNTRYHCGYNVIFFAASEHDVGVFIMRDAFFIKVCDICVFKAEFGVLSGCGKLILDYFGSYQKAVLGVFVVSAVVNVGIEAYAGIIGLYVLVILHYGSLILFVPECFKRKRAVSGHIRHGSLAGLIYFSVIFPAGKLCVIFGKRIFGKAEVFVKCVECVLRFCADAAVRIKRNGKELLCGNAVDYIIQSFKLGNLCRGAVRREEYVRSFAKRLGYGVVRRVKNAADALNGIVSAGVIEYYRICVKIFIERRIFCGIRPFIKIVAAVCPELNVARRKDIRIEVYGICIECRRLICRRESNVYAQKILCTLFKRCGPSGLYANRLKFPFDAPKVTFRLPSVIADV